MSTLPTAPVVRNVFRACVVTAVRESEALMAQLIAATRTALTSEEETTRNVTQRDTASDALRLLTQHEAALIKAYPMALLDIFAEGPVGTKARQADPTGMDFGELSLVDDAQVQAQVELSRAQQVALHKTDASLTELNGLVSAAQGLQRVQPERNPLRPENYIRALQQVITEIAVPANVREAWMQHMRDLLGAELVGSYQRAAQALREHGIQPVGYGVAPTPGGRSGHSGGGSGYGGAYGDSVQGGLYNQGQGQQGYGQNYGTPSMYGAPQSMYGSPVGMGGGVDAGVQEALLTVGILRQMLAGGGDPYESVHMVPVASGYTGHGGHTGNTGYAAAAPVSSYHEHQNHPNHQNYPSAATEALEDIAQLERLVGRLAQTQPEQASRSALLGAQRSKYGAPYGAYGAYAAGSAEPAAASIEVVARMVENIAQDSRLLPPVQRAVQDLEPAICQLVQHDPRFFSDSGHPARRLLDELTQRSLAFSGEDAPGFSRFMRLTNEVVTHLTSCAITSAAPFETVLKALQAAWDAQEKKVQALRQAEEEKLLKIEQRQLLTEKITAGIRSLAGVEQVPSDVMDFAAGPWAEVVALAQINNIDKKTDDPGGYVALVSDLFWSVQPELARADIPRLRALVPPLLQTLRTGMQSIDYPLAKSNALLARLLNLHRSFLAVTQPAHPPRPARPVRPPLPQEAPLLPDSPVQTQPPPAEASEIVEVLESAEGVEVLEVAEAADSLTAPIDSAAVPLEASVEEQFVVGAWIELTTNRRKVRTQLTWASPHNTLFLFTAADGSTQSMTRRMRDKLAADGTLRVISAQPVIGRALDALGKPRKSSRRPPTVD